MMGEGIRQTSRFWFCFAEKNDFDQGMEIIYGSESFFVSTPEVDFAITAQGGHLAPVDFYFGDYAVSPYALAPWQPDEIDASLPPLLTQLRGDFFCLPFGGQAGGPPHGDPANAKWSLVEQGERFLILEMPQTDSGAAVKKKISVREGQQALYVEHWVSGLEGNWNYGNHPVLDFSDLALGQGRLAVSPFRWASVYDGLFANPEAGETGRLQPSARFSELSAVPCADGSAMDLTHYPTPVGHEDLVMMVNQPATSEQPFGWSAATFDNYVWFSLKRVSDFPATLFWVSNGGRSAHPWESRHVGRVGIEEICGHFCNGLEASREDRLAAEGIPTTRSFCAQETVRLPIIQGVALVEPDFGKVTAITPMDATTLVIHGENDALVQVKIDWQEFLEI